MIGTILKHEFLRTLKPLIIVTSILTLLILLGASTGFFYSALGLILAATGVLMLGPVVQWYLGIDFYISSYAGPGATLTHTLPVSGGTLYWSKLLYALIVSLIYLLLTAAILWTMVTVAAEQQLISEVLDVLMSSPAYLVFFGLVGVLALASLPITLFFCAVIGSGGWARRLGVGGPVIVYVAFYIATQLLALATLWVPPSVDMETGTFSSDVNIFESEAHVPLSVFFVQLVLLIVMVVWSAHAMKKKVELN